MGYVVQNVTFPASGLCHLYVCAITTENAKLKHKVIILNTNTFFVFNI